MKLTKKNSQDRFHKIKLSQNVRGQFNENDADLDVIVIRTVPESLPELTNW